MEIKRERTLFFSFRDVDFVPLEIEIHRWFMKLGIIDDQLVVIDLHYHTKNVVAKFKYQNQFEIFFKRHSQGIPFDKQGKIHIIPVFMAGSPWKKVQIKYVPDEMDITLFHKALESYGKIKKIEFETPTLDLLKTKREKLSVEMIVNKNIPSFISVMETRFAVSYTGQRKTCARCDSEMHEARHCEVGKRSYSQAVEGSPSFVLAIDALKELVYEAEKVDSIKTGKNKVVGKEEESEISESDMEEEEQHTKKRERKVSEESIKGQKKETLIKRYRKRVKPNLKVARKDDREQVTANSLQTVEKEEILKSDEKKKLLGTESNQKAIEEKATSPTEEEINDEWPENKNNTERQAKNQEKAEELNKKSLEKIRTITLTKDKEQSVEEKEGNKSQKKKKEEILIPFSQNIIDKNPDIKTNEEHASAQSTNLTPIL
jgi:hypothetical protein